MSVTVRNSRIPTTLRRSSPVALLAIAVSLLTLLPAAVGETVQETAKHVTFDSACSDAGNPRSEMQGANADRSEPTQMVEVQIATHTLQIRAGYVSGFLGYTGYAQIHALLPCLLPEDKSNSPEFHKVGPGQVLIATLSQWKDSQIEGQALLDVYRGHTAFVRRSTSEQLAPYPEPNKIPGTHFITFKDELLSSDIYAARRMDGSMLILRCSIKDGLLRYPVCVVAERLWGDVLLEYSFSRSFIEDNVENSSVIDDRLRRLLSMFRSCSDCVSSQEK